MKKHNALNVIVAILGGWWALILFAINTLKCKFKCKFYKICYIFLGKRKYIRKYIKHTKSYKSKFLPIYFAFKHFKQAYSWICSSEFKKNYFDTKHPYPPLLNPATIDYAKISPNLAYALNLPLPRVYDCIFLRIYGCASGASIVYLKKCGFFVTKSFQDSGFSFWQGYCDIYGELQKPKSSKIVLDLLLHDFDEKFLYLVDRNVPLLLVTRDPISVIKTYANHTGPAANKIRDFNLTFDYDKILATNLKYDNGKNPSVADFTHYAMGRHFFTFERALAHFKANEKIIIDAKDLAQDKVYDTLKFLSKRLDFTLPSKENLENIENTTLLLHWLNVRLWLYDEDVPNIFIKGKINKENSKSLKNKNGISVLIATPFMLDVYYVASEYEHFSGIYPKGFCLYIKKDEAKILYAKQKLYKACVQYLSGFCQALENKIQVENKKRLSENDVLAYFASHNDKKALYKREFDINLHTIKSLAPDIIGTWQHYSAFEKLCKDNDKF